MPDGIWYVDSLMGRNNIPWIQVRSVERQSPYVDTTFHIHLMPNGRVTIPRELVSYKDAQDVISQIWLRIEKLTRKKTHP